MRLLAALAAVLAAAPAAHAATCPAPSGKMTAAAFVKLVGTGQPVRLRDKAVSGRVEIRHATAPISCRRCSFESLVLRDAVIERLLALQELRGVGLLDVTGAAFRQPVLLGVTEGCTIARSDFFLATFDDVADFEGTAFGTTSFLQTRFRGSTDFAATSFAGPAPFVASSFATEVRFDGAVFKGRTSFEGASFGGRTQFLRTSFGRQPCSGRGPSGSVGFTSATFAKEADFGQSMFCGEATFQRTRFDGGASFLGASFFVPRPPPPQCDPDNPPDTGVTLDHVAAGGDLDFTAVQFSGTPQFVGVSAPALVLEETAFDPCVPLELTDLASIEDLRLAPGDADRVENAETRIQVLRAIEASAKARDDLGVANDARYRLLDLTSEREGSVRRFLDHVFYRGVAGYFVRPFRPLLCLLVLAAIASLVRALWSPAPAGVRVRPRVRTPTRLERTTHALNRFLTELGRTLSLRQRTSPDAPLYRKVEGAIYAVLLVCFAIGLANSSPTLKQFVDALL